MENSKENSGYKNLIPFSQETKEKARELGAKGGKKSGEAKRKKKFMKEISQAMLDCDLSDNDKESIKDIFPTLKDSELSVATLLLSKQFERAKEGDPKSFEIIRDTSGNKPVDKKDITSDGETIGGIEERDRGVLSHFFKHYSNRVNSKEKENEN